MSDIHFSNYKLEENKDYFLYIGELKNYGLNRFLKEALSRIENRNFDFISIVPDVFEQYNYKNLIVINPETKNYSCKPGGKVSCRIPAQEITPISKEAFKQISKRVSAVLNQAVLLRGVNNSFVKMWKLCETIQESYVRPYYIFNCSYRNPQFAHIRVPVEKGRGYRRKHVREYLRRCHSAIHCNRRGKDPPAQKQRDRSRRRGPHPHETMESRSG